MLTASTNLALRPFRNERLPWLLAGLLSIAALVTTFVHGRFVSRLLSRDEAGTVREVRENDARIAELEARLSSEPPIKIEPSELIRLRAFKELVDRRIFPWRRLLSELETTLSNDVRLTRISPFAAKDGSGMLVELAGEARTKDAAFSLAEGLDASPAFSRAALRSLSENDDVVEFDIEVLF
ncbi:MAG: PilN domain-containing protein, partial [Vicinamibacteria bacterium]|nr:PilN domain-containing protein [Vicinamibacteria bacterium]